MPDLVFQIDMDKSISANDYIAKSHDAGPLQGVQTKPMDRHQRRQSHLIGLEFVAGPGLIVKADLFSVRESLPSVIVDAWVQPLGSGSFPDRHFE